MEENKDNEESNLILQLKLYGLTTKLIYFYG